MFYFKDFMLQSISKTKFAPVSEVVFEVSYAGDTSTRSQPTMLRPLHPINKNNNVCFTSHAKKRRVCTFKDH